MAAPVPHRPAVILVRPQEEGNVGAAARAMANMGLDELILVDPLRPPGDVARARAVGAEEILERSRTVAGFARAVAPFDRVVGTTSSRGRTAAAEILTPRELAGRLAADLAASRVALVFGPERSGLTTEELARCSPLVRVPCASRQPTLNLAQAVLVVAYELYLAGGPDAAERVERPPAAAGDVEGLFAQLEPLLRDVGFARDDTFAATLRDLRRLAGRAALTEREVTLLRGIARRTHNTLVRR